MISVVIPVRDCVEWIEDAIKSVSNQTVRPGEILVADDGSLDGTVERILALGISEVRLLPQVGRIGISAQMNRLVSEARGRFVSRMDGDDISHPRRFELQLAFMERNSLSVVGSWSRRFGASRTLHRFDETDGLLKAGLLFSTPFCNPTSVMDRERYKGVIPSYDESYLAAGDYKYWVEHRTKGKYGNVQSSLLDWRLHDRNMGTDPVMGPLQRKNSTKIREMLLRDYGLELSPPERRVLDERIECVTFDHEESRLFLEVLSKIRSVPSNRIHASSSEVGQVLGGHWNLSCLISAWDVPRMLHLWLQGNRRLGLRFEPAVAGKILIKSWIGRLRRGRRQ